MADVIKIFNTKTKDHVDILWSFKKTGIKEPMAGNMKTIDSSLIPEHALTMLKAI